MAHGRSFLPPHLIGRGVSFINMFGIGGAGNPAVRLALGLPLGRWRGRPRTYLCRSLHSLLVPVLIGLALYLFSRNIRTRSQAAPNVALPSSIALQHSLSLPPPLR